MQEILELVSGYLRAIWLKRWYCLGIAWLVCVIGWAAVYQLPDEYKASARVHIDTQSFLRPLLRGLAFSTSANQQVKLMVQTLLSRPNLEKIARITDLDLQATNEIEMDELTEELRDGIQLVQVNRQENLYEVSFAHADRDVAKRVVQAVLTVFVERTLGENREESVTAQRFLENELKEYEARLKEAEQRVVEFKRKNIDFLSSAGSDYYQRMQAARGELESVKLSLTEAIRQRDSISEQIEDFEDAEDSLLDFGVGSSASAATSVDGRISVMQSRLDELLIRFTEKHPDVVTLKSQLADLESKRAEELAAIEDAGLENTENPMIQSLKLNLSQAEAQVAGLKVRVSNFEGKVKKLQQLVHTLPTVDAELTGLNRDYNVVKNKYNQLLERREQAKISQKASQSSDDIEFKVIDPARVPYEPSGPNRILFMSIVLAAGLALGVGFGLLMALIKPAFHSVKMLALETGLPVLGSVSYTLNDGQLVLDRKMLWAYMLLTFLLIVSYGLLLLWQLLISNAVGI